jgi:hypothetical protein
MSGSHVLPLNFSFAAIRDEAHTPRMLEERFELLEKRIRVRSKDKAFKDRYPRVSAAGSAPFAEVFPAVGFDATRPCRYNTVTI